MLYTVLKADNVDPFIDFKSALERLEKIVANDDAELAKAARRLIGAANDAKHW